MAAVGPVLQAETWSACSGAAIQEGIPKPPSHRVLWDTLILVLPNFVILEPVSVMRTDYPVHVRISGTFQMLVIGIML